MYDFKLQKYMKDIDRSLYYLPKYNNEHEIFTILVSTYIAGMYIICEIFCDRDNFNVRSNYNYAMCTFFLSIAIADNSASL